MSSLQRIHFQLLDSTNTEAKRIIDNGEAKHGTMISADFQTHGRGQFGRVWESSQAQNAMMSLILKPKALAVSEQFQLNIVTSLAVLDVIEEYGLSAQVKWPNDIYVSDNKICGILIQNFLKGATIQHTIIGVGLNVNQLSWPQAVPNPTSLSKELSMPLDVNEVTDLVARSIMSRFDRIDARDELKKAYHDKMYRRGEVSRFMIGDEVVLGEIIGIDDSGQMMVAHDKSLQAYQHGEISFVP